MWRPEEAVWINIKRERCKGQTFGKGDCEHCPTTPMECDTSFEAGADEILGALKNSGNFVIVGKDTLTLPGFMTEVDDYLHSLGDGTWVFVPEEE